MTKEELVARLRDIEWDDFEVKAAKSDLPKNIWETVSAFSNCSGGWIVLGVKQSGRIFEIVGVDNIEKLEQDFFGTLRSCLQTHNCQNVIRFSLFSFHVVASSSLPYSLYFCFLCRSLFNSHFQLPVNTRQKGNNR